MKFKSIILLVILSVMSLGCGTISAQQKRSKRQQKPPRTYDIVKNIDELPDQVSSGLSPKEFTSEDGSFKAKWFSTPKQTQSMLDLPLGKARLIYYRTIFNNTIYEVNYFDLPTAIRDQEQIKTRYDAVLESYIKNPQIKIISVADFKSGEFRGKEITCETLGETVALRFLLAGQRFFQLSVSIPQHIGSATKSVRDSFEQKSAVFFDSFQIATIPLATTEISQLPNDFDLSVDEKTFTSKFFGFSVQLPDKWIKLNSEESEFYKKAGTEIFKEKNSAMSSQIDTSMANSRILLTLTKLPVGMPNNASICFGVERSPLASATVDKAAESILKLFVDKFGFEKMDPVQPIKIGNLDFAVFEVFNTQLKIRQKLFVAIRKGILLEIALTYSNDVDAQIMIESVKSITFEKQ